MNLTKERNVMKMKIGIDLGGSHIGIGLLNNDNELLEKVEKNRKESFESEAEISQLIESYIDKFVSENSIELIGIATPGNVKENKMQNLFNLGISKLDFTPLIAKYPDIRFLIQNDSKAAAKAELRYGALREDKDSVFLCLGTGIGSAVFMNRRLLQANKNTGFELGHMIIEKDGKLCHCGKRGCFETYCSIKRWKEKIKEELRLPEASSERLVEIVKEQKENPIVQKSVEEYIEYFLVGLSNIIDIFEPESICLGGSFVYFKDIFYDELVKKLESTRCVFNKDSVPKIVLAELKNDAGIIGAVLE